MYQTNTTLKKASMLMLGAAILLGGMGIGHAQMSVGATPLKTVLELNPGETQTFEIKAINRNDAPLAYQIDVQMAEADGEFGNASFRPATPEDQWAVPNWITVQNPKLTVPPHEMSPVNFSIAVPADTPPGGYYGMVLFSPAEAPTDGGNVAIIGQIGTPILVKVKGAIEEVAQVDSFGLDEANLRDGEAIPLSIRLLNEGNVHILPEGQIELYANGEKLKEVATVRNDDGSMEVVDYIPLNPGKGYTLPGKPRVYLPKWESNLRYGDITAKYSFQYGREKVSTLTGEEVLSITKDIEISKFEYDRANQRFLVSLKNTGTVQMPVRGQINIYSAAGGDARVTISFPQEGEATYLAGGEEKEVTVDWTGLEVLQPSETNQFNAVLSYVVDKDANDVRTAKVDLPYGDLHGAAFDMNQMLPYVIIGLLIVMIGVLMMKKQRPTAPTQQ